MLQFDKHQKMGEENIKLKASVKKLKSGIERKDVNMSNIREKLDSTMLQVNDLKTKTFSKNQSTVLELKKSEKEQAEVKKKLRKQEHQFQILQILLKRVFKEN